MSFGSINPPFLYCIVEVVLADFSDIVVDVQLRFTPSGAVEVPSSFY